MGNMEDSKEFIENLPESIGEEMFPSQTNGVVKMDNQTPGKLTC